MLCAILYHFQQFKKHEKHPWRSVTLVKLQAGFFNWVLNCTNDTQSVSSKKKKKN